MGTRAKERIRLKNEFNLKTFREVTAYERYVKSVKEYLKNDKADEIRESNS